HADVAARVGNGVTDVACPQGSGAHHLSTGLNTGKKSGSSPGQKRAGTGSHDEHKRYSYEKVRRAFLAPEPLPRACNRGVTVSDRLWTQRRLRLAVKPVLVLPSACRAAHWP